MINLTRKQVETVLDGDQTVVINGKTYYVKRGIAPIMELLGEELAKCVGITCAHYEVFKAVGEVFLISESLTDGQREFKTARQYGLTSNNLYTIWRFLEGKQLKNVPELMEKILKIYFFDSILTPGDRHNNNWGFILENNEIVDVCILDNEELMFSETTHMSAEIDTQNEESDINIIQVLKDLDSFLKDSDDIYMRAFKEVYEKLNPDFVFKVLEDISLRENLAVVNIKDLYLEYFDHYMQLQELIDSRGLK